MASPKNTKKGGKKASSKKGGDKKKKEFTSKDGAKISAKIKANKTRKTFNKGIKAVAGKKNSINSKGIKVLNAFAQDIIARVGSAAGNILRATGRKTLTAALCSQAVRMVLPADAARQANAEAAKAVASYQKTVPKRENKGGEKKPKKSKKSKK